jgi:hypothetical protein
MKHECKLTLNECYRLFQQTLWDLKIGQEVSSNPQTDKTGEVSVELVTFQNI